MLSAQLRCFELVLNGINLNSAFWQNGNLVLLNIQRLKINQNIRLLLLNFHFEYKAPYKCTQSHLPCFFCFQAEDSRKYYNHYENQCHSRKSSH